MIRFSTTVTCQYDTPFAPFPAARFACALDWVRDSRFDGAEICISDYSNVDVGALKDALDRRNLVCSTISTGQARTLENISLTHADPSACEKARRRILEHIDAAHVLDSKVTIGLLRGLGTAQNRENELQLLRENLMPCLEYAETQNVTLLLEPINRYETALLNSAEQAVTFLDMLGNPKNLGILWDVFHANIEDADFEKTIHGMGSRLRHVHLADSNRGMPGCGHIDFGSVYDCLAASGFDGFLSFECWNLPSAEAVIAGSGPFIQRLRRRRRDPDDARFPLSH